MEWIGLERTLVSFFEIFQEGRDAIELRQRWVMKSTYRSYASSWCDMICCGMKCVFYSEVVELR